VKKLVAQQRKLDADEEEAGDEVIQLQAKMSALQSQLADAASRLARIRRIRKKTKERSSELFRRGIQELDSEDGVLPALEAHEHWVVEDIQALGVPNDVDWEALGLGSEFQDVGPLLDVGESSGVAPGDTAVSAGGTSPNAT
jgi:hypothetical protein